MSRSATNTTAAISTQPRRPRSKKPPVSPTIAGAHNVPRALVEAKVGWLALHLLERLWSYRDETGLTTISNDALALYAKEPGRPRPGSRRAERLARRRAEAAARGDLREICTASTTVEKAIGRLKRAGFIEQPSKARQGSRRSDGALGRPGEGGLGFQLVDKNVVGFRRRILGAPSSVPGSKEMRVPETVFARLTEMRGYREGQGAGGGAPKGNRNWDGDGSSPVMVQKRRNAAAARGLKLAKQGRRRDNLSAVGDNLSAVGGDNLSTSRSLISLSPSSSSSLTGKDLRSGGVASPTPRTSEVVSIGEDQTTRTKAPAMPKATAATPELGNLSALGTSLGGRSHPVSGRLRDTFARLCPRPGPTTLSRGAKSRVDRDQRGLALTPEPPTFSPDLSDDEAVEILVRTYRQGLEAKFGVVAMAGLSGLKPETRKRLRLMARVLRGFTPSFPDQPANTDLAVSPLQFVSWQIDRWRELVAKEERNHRPGAQHLPQLGAVFPAKYEESAVKLRDEFRKDAFALSHNFKRRTVRGPILKSLQLRHHRLEARLGEFAAAGDPDSQDRALARAIDSAFPEGYWDAVEDAADENQRITEDLVRRAAAGEWLPEWGGKTAPRKLKASNPDDDLARIEARWTEAPSALTKKPKVESR